MLQLLMLLPILLFASVEPSFLENPDTSPHKIEFFLQKPDGDGPFPVLFLVHGYQPINSNGGQEFVDLNYLSKFVKEGIVAVAISVPGFGASEGSRDCSGPASQKAIAAVIHHFAKSSFIDPQRMGIYGISRGAILASMVPKYAPMLSLQILESGCYDLTQRDSLLPDYLIGMKKNMILETGGTSEALIERSALYNTKYIQGKTLVLAGEFDDRRPLPSSLALHEKLTQEGKHSQINILPNELHFLSELKWEIIKPFLRKHFFHLYGIGINVSSVIPAIQISKVLPNSPAEGKLCIGDAILRISPNNDDHEIDALGMPPSQFISLVLGKKGTLIRLHVQHFDKTYEDIVVERG